MHIPAIEQGTSQQMTLGMAHKNNISHNQTALFSPNSCMPAIHHLIVHVLVRMLSRILNHIQQYHWNVATGPNLQLLEVVAFCTLRELL
jgi:hypothetical protein